MRRPPHSYVPFVWTALFLCSGACSSTPNEASRPPPDSGFGADSIVDAQPDAMEEANASDAPVVCAPGDPVYTPTYHPPLGPYESACTASQLAGLGAACFASTAATAACDAWVDDPSNSSCKACWAGNVTQARWAPFLFLDNPGQMTFANLAGCIALSDPSALACAKSSEDAFECNLAACESECPIPSTGDTRKAMTAFLSCFDEASCGVCATQNATANACAGTLTAGSGPAAYCGDINSNGGHLIEYIALACGAPPTDGGSPIDAAADALSD